MMIELLFLLGFTLHNIEEAIWLPEWSKHAGRFHEPVKAHSFYFAVIMVTTLGYLLTFQYFIFGSESLISRYAYLGFIAMMVLNVLFPHVVATLMLRRYAPGTLTGLLLNAPIGLYLIFRAIHTGKEYIFLIIATFLITLAVLALIHQLFRLADHFVAPLRN